MFATREMYKKKKKIFRLFNQTFTDYNPLFFLLYYRCCYAARRFIIFNLNVSGRYKKWALFVFTKKLYLIKTVTVPIRERHHISEIFAGFTAGPDSMNHVRNVKIYVFFFFILNCINFFFYGQKKEKKIILSNFYINRGLDGSPCAVFNFTSQ